MKLFSTLAGAVGLALVALSPAQAADLGYGRPGAYETWNRGGPHPEYRGYDDYRRWHHRHRYEHHGWRPYGHHGRGEHRGYYRHW